MLTNLPRAQASLVKIEATSRQAILPPCLPRPHENSLELLVPPSSTLSGMQNAPENHLQFVPRLEELLALLEGPCLRSEADDAGAWESLRVWRLLPLVDPLG